jgi:hypothetical protein
MLSKEQIAEIEQRAKKATPGPWYVDDVYQIIQCENDSDDTVIADYSFISDFDVCRDDVDFIASARTDIPALLEHIRELEAQLAKEKRRAEKAVADLKYIAVCETCKKSGVTEYPESAVIQCEYYDSECGCGKYEWRGDAEEGAER